MRAAAEHLGAALLEVLPHHGHEPHVGEERRRQREVRGRAADHPVRLAERVLDRIERDRADRQDRECRQLASAMSPTSRTCR